MSPPRSRTPAGPPGSGAGGVGHVVDIDVETEMQGAFLEYAYSVIYSRALPDARDGLKPVQRRIVYQMADMGLRPDRAHVKSARVVGDVMGKLHPHGDGAIYDALVRLAQPFTMRLPLVDGHGNFGSPDAGPAAARYTEARPAPAAVLLTAGLDEDVVDTVDNYDGSLQQPEVLPAAFPNLLVNGASGIAVGMATNMAPHNLAEVVAAARHLLVNPRATTADLVRFVPGPDFPTGGIVVGLDGVREAYESGRGTFRIRGTVEVESVTARRKGLVVTELPYGVGPERLIERIKEAVQAKRLDGISGLQDLSDRRHGMRVVVELRSGFDPDAVLEQLYRLTPLEETFGVNNVALVDGRPRTLGLRELLRVYVDFRTDVVTRRTRYRLRVAEADLHLVEGLLVAVLNVDEVIQVIRSSEDAGEARTRLMGVFELSETQAEHILQMRLRRLTRFSTIELQARRDELVSRIEELRTLLGSEELLRGLVSDELDEVAAEHGTPRRTVLLEGSGARAKNVPATLEIADTACRVLLGAGGLLARSTDDGAFAVPVTARDRSRHDVVVAAVATTVRSDVGVVTDRGRVVRVPVVDLPALPPSAGPPALSGGVPVAEAAGLAAGESVVGLTALSPDGPGLALATALGVVKRVVPEAPGTRIEWDVLRLAPDDRVIAAFDLPEEGASLVLVADDASLLHFPAAAVRPQGRAGGGVAGIRLAPGARVLFAGAVPAEPDPDRPTVVATAAGATGQLSGSPASSVKVTPFEVYPAKGRATGGVRAHRFLRGEDVLVAAWVGPAPALGAGPTGAVVQLPPQTSRRDGSGSPVPGTLVHLGGVPW